MTFDVQAVRRDFPALHQEVHGKPLVYLDSAATALKPQSVIDAVTQVYARDCANIHRAVHTLSQRATAAYESARAKVQGFIGAETPEQVLFTRGTTEGINLVRFCYARPRLAAGDEVVVTGLEHHSNIVPWQIVCEQTGAKLRVVDVNDAGEVSLESFAAVITKKTRIVAMAHVSNALGTVLPVRDVAKLAHEVGAVVVVDGAQAAPHLPVNVQELGCDFYALSGHKLYGPSGIGVLYGKRELLEAMPPYEGGGDMIRSVTFEKTVYDGLPNKFEAGTPNIAGAIGLGAAVDYVQSIGFEALENHEHELIAHGTEVLCGVPGLRLIGTAKDKRAVLSFVMEGAHPQDIGTLLDAQGIAVRTGHHCAEPLMHRMSVPATARASLGMYNTKEELTALSEGLHRVAEMFA